MHVHDLRPAEAGIELISNHLAYSKNDTQKNYFDLNDLIMRINECEPYFPPDNRMFLHNSQDDEVHQTENTHEYIRYRQVYEILDSETISDSGVPNRYIQISL